MDGIDAPLIADGMTLRRGLVMLWLLVIGMIVAVRTLRRRRRRAEGRRVRAEFEHDPEGAAARYGHEDFDAWEDAREIGPTRSLTSTSGPRVRRDD